MFRSGPTRSNGSTHVIGGDHLVEATICLGFYPISETLVGITHCLTYTWITARAL